MSVPEPAAPVYLGAGEKNVGSQDPLGVPLNSKALEAQLGA